MFFYILFSSLEPVLAAPSVVEEVTSAKEIAGN
jgi:hypothetical protein